MAETKQKSKIAAVRVLSDDCTIAIGREVQDGEITHPGTLYNVHEGEWVDIIPVQSMKEQLALSALVGAGADVDAPAMEMARRMYDPLQTLCSEIANRLVAWNWTDNEGEPLPSPYKQPSVVIGLANDEIMWLLTAAQGETGAQRKNGSTP